jgi:ABC-type antimicrobial peptide transport system permease subunit
LQIGVDRDHQDVSPFLAGGRFEDLRMAFAILPTAIIVAVILSLAVAFLFGYYPARKASRLDPIDAIRYE